MPSGQRVMTRAMDCLPPIYRKGPKGRDHGLADCSPELGNLSSEIINCSNEEPISRLEFSLRYADAHLGPYLKSLNQISS